MQLTLNYIILIANLIIFALFFYMHKYVFLNKQDTQIIKNKSRQNKHKKRKINIFNKKKHNKTPIFHLKYKKITKIHTLKKLNKICNEQNKTYIEIKNRHIYISIKTTTKKIQDKINKNQILYRSINNQCIIESVAISLANSILLQKNFNVYESFKELSQVVKVYKKEAEILSFLLASELIKIFIYLHQEITTIKKHIKKGGHIKNIKNLSKLHPATIYGIYLKNPIGYKLLNNKQNLIIKSTTNLLNSLDEIYYKQRIIFNYISHVLKGIF